MNTIQLTITDMSTTGHGIALNKERSIFVLGTFPGDVVNVSVYKSIKNIDYAEIESFVEYSPMRAEKPLKKPFFKPNVPWEHLAIEHENNIKEEFVEKLYSDQININNFQKLLFPDGIFETQYRNKVAYSFTTDQNQNLCFALYSRGISKIEKTEQLENILVHPELEKAGKQFLEFFKQKKLKLSDIKYLTLRYSYYENKIVAHILIPETNRKKIAFKKSALEKFIHQNPQVKGILVSHSEKNIRSSTTTKDFYRIGDINSVEQVLDKKYSYHPSLFFQIYPKAFEQILIDVRNLILQIPKHESLELLDLFAGVGVIGLEVADLVLHVIGVELSSLSKKYALQNAKQNNISNFDFVERDVDTALLHIQENQILIVDPTRAGLSKQTIDIIREKQPQYIFYISCNPETQYRDFEKIEKFYKLTFIKAYNIFPKTHHIESMVVLEKK